MEEAGGRSGAGIVPNRDLKGGDGAEDHRRAHHESIISPSDCQLIPVLHGKAQCRKKVDT